ncbi:MAG: anaerobic carbon-monoxide dehydrogenase catalytic subunit [Deltaproteobacteria bacterium]|nr:anaerobic carbon-monoxide dehydrogenase catalytic subunit [Deltaproteobacteria bacterium]
MAKLREIQDVTICETTAEMLKKARDTGLSTAFDRADEMSACPIGAKSACCKHCVMGPCRLSSKAPYDKVGVCGATIDTIQARNFARMVAAGTAAHSDHGREMSELFLSIAKGENPDYQIRDEAKLLAVAKDLGVETEGREVKDVAVEVAEICLSQFSQQHGHLKFLERAPEARFKKWQDLGLLPRGVDREVVEMMHRTAMGVDQDYKNLTLGAARCALADGWGGSMVSTELSDIMFGTPKPIRGEVDLGVLDAGKVNVVVHGHEPHMLDMLCELAEDPEMLAKAKEAGAEGINLVGMCCSGNEQLIRRGLKHAGNFMQCDAVIITGAVDGMMVDVQCIQQGLVSLSQCFHTKFFTTNYRCKIEGAEHIEFHGTENARQAGVELLTKAIENFKNRDASKVTIPDTREQMIGGFSHETINYMLGGTFRASYTPLNDNIINGRIRGVAGVVGCTNPRVKHDWVHYELVKELLANDVLVVQTGCSAITMAKMGFMQPEAAAKYCGPGLREVCEAVGMPPVLHSGACVDNSRILVALSEMVKTGGLGDDISDLPVAGAAPEYMSEKAIAIGHYFVASGVFTVFGVTFPAIEGTKWAEYLFGGIEEDLGGKWAFESDPNKMAALMIDHINKKREALGIHKKKERVLFDMEARRQLEV